jgi:polyisoprenoid-binding protein YceI
VLDPAGQGSRIEVVIDATSGDTGHDGLNQKLLGASFFNTARFPEIPLHRHFGGVQGWQAGARQWAI